MHFLHVRSERPDAKPLLITHGYPSSVAEFLHLIQPLVDPADGQAFDVIAPSLPGYAFSTPLSATGWAMGRTGRAWVELMRRLGYERYGVHGGDVGAGVSGMVAGLDSEHVIGVHVVTDPLTAAFLPGMADRLDADDPTDKLILERMNTFTKEGSGYLVLQGGRPLQSQLDGDSATEERCRDRQNRLNQNVPFPMWARRTNPALAYELGIAPDGVSAMTVLPNGQVVTASGASGMLLLWNPTLPGSRPRELGEHGVAVSAMTSTPENAIITATAHGRMFLWSQLSRRAQTSSSGHARAQWPIC